MKTKELIRRLQEEDPEGEAECCIGNADILFVEKVPAFYDGRLQVLIRDEKLKPFYDVVGAKITGHGEKVFIVKHSIEDMLLDDPELPVDLSEVIQPQWKEWCERDVEMWRKEARDIHDELTRKK